MTTITRTSSRNEEAEEEEEEEEAGPVTHQGTTTESSTTTETTTETEEPTTTTTFTNTTTSRGQSMDASTIRIDLDPHEGHKQPQRGRDDDGGGEEEMSTRRPHDSSEQPRGKTSLSLSHNPHHLIRTKDSADAMAMESGVTTRPGAVMVGGGTTNALDRADVPDEDDEPIENDDNDDDDVVSHQQHLPIAAQLVPDSSNSNGNSNGHENDVEARIEQEVEARMRQRDETIVVVVAEAKPVRTYAAWLTGRKGIVTIFLLLVVLGGGVGGLLYGLLKKDDDNKQVTGGQPTIVDPVILRRDALVEELQSWIAPTEDDLLPFQDPTSPQSQALVWLQDDPITQTPGRSTRTVLERYVVVVLFYAMFGGPSSWNLDFVYNTTLDVCTWNEGVANEKNQTHPYYRGGIHCVMDDSAESESDSIERIIIVDNKLRGTLPWELVLLTNLKYINVGSNGLTGSIPTRIHELTRLETFFAANNGLSGSLPFTFAPSTVFISLSDCYMTGSIPDSWGTSMPALQTLYLRANVLTGTLPSTLGQLTDLITLDVKDNLLTGTLPSQLRQMTALEQLFVSLNSLSGSMDEGLCALMTTLRQVEADCGEVYCPCCTTCCYSNEQCQEVVPVSL